HYDIRKPRQQAAFIAQTGYESQWFQRWVENLNYSTPQRIRNVWPYRFRSVGDAVPYVRNPQKLANFVYANRIGNGDVHSGDGWRFRGRGILQLTGKDNYREAQLGMKIPLLSQPELLEEKEYAAASAGWWWHNRSLNYFADRDDIDAISGYINRGDPGKTAHGEDERRDAYVHALQVLEG
ncbi:MAG: glycoside hydrolase family 19 protein, partial [Solirubrobacterales bacterium]|nr:glycoside hydrolase family 19 protein [Solirubrobacterales bacterium]